MSDYFDRIERQLTDRARQRAGSGRRRTTVLLGSLSAAVVVAVVAVFVTVGHRGPGSAGRHHRSGVVAQRPAAGTGILVLAPVTTGPGLIRALDTDVVILRHRLAALDPQVSVTRVEDRIVLDRIPPGQRAGVLRLRVPGRLRLLDWESDVVLPGGRTVTAGLRTGDRRALVISQGIAGGAPGETPAGAMGAFAAVELAAHQSADGARGPGADYLFTRDGSGCRLTPCLVLGPVPAGAPLATLRRGLIRVTVPGGVLVLQAAAGDPARTPGPTSPAARFFVLRDRPLLSAGELAGARDATSQSGGPAVSFTFTSAGTRAFHAATAALARRGAELSSFGQTLNQHFAIALDDRILIVAAIDFRAYPDGLGEPAAQITGGLTRETAAELAAILRTRPLAVPLTALSNTGIPRSP